jgi:hypothetical protein
MKSKRPASSTTLSGCLFWGGLLSVTDDLTAPFVCHLVWTLLVLFVRPL